MIYTEINSEFLKNIPVTTPEPNPDDKRFIYKYVRQNAKPSPIKRSILIKVSKNSKTT